MTETHDRFRDRLIKSAPAIFAVARWLHLQGLDVEIDGLDISPSAREASDHSDSGDIYVAGRGVVEVRARWSVAWSSRDTYKYSNVLIGKVEGHDDRVERLNVQAYIMVSKNLIQGIEIPISTRSLWTKRKAPDQVTGKMCDCYQIEKGLVRFFDLREVGVGASS